MQVIRITLLLAIVSLIEASYGQCIRIRSGNGPQPCNQPPCCQPSSCGQPSTCGSPCGQSCATCGTSIEDLTTLLAIVRALEEKEAPRSTINNAEEIILQLVNALVYATTQNVGCPKSGGTGISAGGGVNVGGNGGISAGGGINVGGSGGITAGGGLNVGGNGGGISAGGGLNVGGKGGITAGGGLNVGGSGGNGNGGTPPAGGTGGNGGGHPRGYPTGTPIPMEYNDDGVITLDLLGPDYDLVRLGIAGNNILDVGLGS